VPSADEWRDIFRQAGLDGRVTRDLTDLYSPRPDAEADRLVSGAERQLADLDDPDGSDRYAIEAVIGGYVLEKLYNRRIMKYMMFKAIKG
jgi:hypothetical protein